MTTLNNKNKVTFGSVCSGVEASQLAFEPYGFEQLWSSEIAEFPSRVLNHHYPNIPNLGNMLDIPKLLEREVVHAPDILCGGTPCQAFSLAGWKNGLKDDRGQLTISFIEIANEIDRLRFELKKEPSIVLWENVEGVLNDRTNAFGNFISALAGFENEIKVSKWSKSGYLEGPLRNVAWRVIDAKYFGLAQQRRRLYVLAGGKNFRPDQFLFEFSNSNIKKAYNSNKELTVKKTSLNDNAFSMFYHNDNVNETDYEYNNENDVQKNRIFYKDGKKIEIFREYTDCLYSAYGTKWNGNAAAYNGSLYVAENDRVRRLTPLECERLMGFPDNYTSIDGSSDTNRFQAIGNSWAVPVVKWIGERIYTYFTNSNNTTNYNWQKRVKSTNNNLGAPLFMFNDIYQIEPDLYLNSSAIPSNPVESSVKLVVQEDEVPSKFFLSPQACRGILRRKKERGLKMNSQLEKLMYAISILE